MKMTFRIGEMILKIWSHFLAILCPSIEENWTHLLQHATAKYIEPLSLPLRGLLVFANEGVSYVDAQQVLVRNTPSHI